MHGWSPQTVCCAAVAANRSRQFKHCSNTKRRVWKNHILLMLQFFHSPFFQWQAVFQSSHFNFVILQEIISTPEYIILDTVGLNQKSKPLTQWCCFLVPTPSFSSSFFFLSLLCLATPKIHNFLSPFVTMKLHSLKETKLIDIINNHNRK